MKKYLTILALAGAASCAHAQDAWVIQFEATPQEQMRQAYELQQIAHQQEMAERRREFQNSLDRQKAESEAFFQACQARRAR